MTIDTSVPRTRRALLAGGIGGMAALVASALGRPLPTSAVDGQTVLVGGEYTASSVTKFDTGATGATALWGRSGSGKGLYGESQTGFGVSGFSPAEAGTAGQSETGVGIYGYTDSGLAGVYGLSSSADGPATVGRTHGGGSGVVGVSGPIPRSLSTPVKTGVFGYAAQDANARGVHGQSTNGRGLYGQATTGVGLYGIATTGYALRTSGRLKVDKASGVATIPATTTSVVVTPGLDVTSTSFVLVTPKADLGARRLWYTTNATANTFTIRVSTAVTANLQVGWLLLG